MKIAIVGSRGISDYHQVISKMKELEVTEIIRAGAAGPNALAKCG